MTRTILTLLIPPIAACRFGCAGCCAAPIGVFWLAAIVAIGYGLVGGPSNLLGPSWNTIGLGLLMWCIAAVWAALVVRNADEERCKNRQNPVCRTTLSATDDSDPFDEVRKAR
jgi:hypothetical protein